MDAPAIEDDAEGFANYGDVENDDDVASELEATARAGQLQARDSTRQLRADLGQAVVLRKIACITKVVRGRAEKRIVVDSRQSGVAPATAKSGRVALPRLIDPVRQALFQLRNQGSGRLTEFAVLDFKDAFFMVTLRPRERRFFAVKFRGRFLAFNVTAAGAALSPLTWGRLAALIGGLAGHVRPLGAAHDHLRRRSVPRPH